MSIRIPYAPFLVALLVAGSEIQCASSGSSQPATDRGDPCADVELDVEKVWSAQIRAEFLQQGGAIGGEQREAVATRMDDVSRDWAMLRRSVCLDYFRRRVITRDDYAKRADCLDHNLQAQRSAIASLKAGNGPSDATTVFTQLNQGLDECRAH